jgi:pSer/pThr/pTyr-binding forkhead associated (FHA) protein
MSGEAPIREEPSRAREEPSARAGASETSLLFVDEYGRAKERLPLRPGKTIIGRTEGDVLLTNDPCVSPWHAQLAVRRSGLLIKDMYSLNGIFLRISRQALLQDGDRFCMGRQVIKFRQGWAAPQPDSQGTRAMGAANPSMAARIMVMTESGEVADQVIIRDVLTIGRAGCNLCFPEDDLLTDKHVQIQFDGRSSYMLIDLASNTGVFLALRSETELSHGDTILIGRQRLMVDRPS